MTLTINGKDFEFKDACCRTLRYESENYFISLCTDAQYSNDPATYWFTIYDRKADKLVKESKEYSNKEQAIRYMKNAMAKIF